MGDLLYHLALHGMLKDVHFTRRKQGGAPHHSRIECVFGEVGFILCERAPDGLKQWFIVNRLGEEFMRASFDRTHRHRNGAMTGEKDDGHPRKKLMSSTRNPRGVSVSSSELTTLLTL
ncbi:hypothetical protein OKW30_001936 [Paraburkholderia sp. Clong3]